MFVGRKSQTGKVGASELPNDADCKLFSLLVPYGSRTTGHMLQTLIRYVHCAIDLPLVSCLAPCFGLPLGVKSRCMSLAPLAHFDVIFCRNKIAVVLANPSPAQFSGTDLRIDLDYQYRSTIHTQQSWQWHHPDAKVRSWKLMTRIRSYAFCTDHKRACVCLVEVSYFVYLPKNISPSPAEQASSRPDRRAVSCIFQIANCDAALPVCVNTTMAIYLLIAMSPM